jgi:hypothetical protein
MNAKTKTECSGSGTELMLAQDLPDSLGGRGPEPLVDLQGPVQPFRG